MFATDRDLLVLMPSLFTEVTWESQRVLSGTCTVSGYELVLNESDVLLDAAGVGPGSVVLVDRTAYEVTARSGGKKLGLSRVRPRGSGVLQPRSGDGPLTIMTFAPQIDLVHGQLLRLAGATESDRVINGDELALVEATGAIAMICLAISAEAPDDSGLASRAMRWRQRFDEECDRVVMRIDSDGDGVADQVRRLNGGLLIRG